MRGYGKLSGSNMANNENLKPWRKGQSGNPSGRKPGSIRADDVDAAMDKFARLKADELADKVADPKTNVLERMIGAVMLKTIETGDASRLEFLLARSIGKVKEVVENHNHDHGKELVKQIPTEKLLQLVNELPKP